jgi:hypothetical protein
LLLIGLAQDLQIVSIFKNFNIVHDIDRDRGADQGAGDQNDITNATGHGQKIGIAPTSGNASHASKTLGIRCWFRAPEPVHLEELEHSAAARIELRLFHRRSPISVAGAVCGGPDVELALSILWPIAVVWLLLRA